MQFVECSESIQSISYMLINCLIFKCLFSFVNMCYNLPTFKNRVKICDILNSLKYINGNQQFSNFCVPNKTGSDIWMSSEFDTENHRHMMLYSGSGDNSQEIDESTHLFPNTIWVVVPTSELLLKVLTLLPVVIFGLLGNSALLYILLKFKNLRTPSNMIIANIAAVDLTYLLVYPWIFLTKDLFQNFELGEIGCKIDGWIECALLINNVINLCAISYDRLTAIVLPRETRLTTKSAKIVILISWTSSLLITLPLLLYRIYKERRWSNYLEKYCTENTKILAVYWILLIVMIVWIPLLVMLICYLAIFIKLDRYEQKVLKRESPICVSYKTRVAKIIFGVLVAFLFCRIPLTALIFQRNNWLKQKTNTTNMIVGMDSTLWYTARYLMYVNAAIDPLIYGLTNEAFRKAFRLIPIVKHCFGKHNVVQKPKPKISIIQCRRPILVTEWKCDKWLNLNESTSEFSKDSSKISPDTTVGSQNNLIN